MVITEEQARAVLYACMSIQNEGLSFHPRTALLILEIFAEFPSTEADPEFIDLRTDPFVLSQAGSP